jgi:hypothetical protein
MNIILGLFFLLLMFAPLSFQFIFGFISTNRSNVPKLIIVSLISMTEQIIVTIINMVNITVSIQKRGFRCGMPMVGI